MMNNNEEIRRKMNFLKNLNKEKQDIIREDGDVLVIANPGTGKTKLLAYKYVYLLNKDVPAEEILCLTFTEKAKRELLERILELIKETESKVDLSKIQVHTFHSFALTYLDDNDVVSNDFLRYSIYKFMKDNQILNYADSYLLDAIVPKMENLIRYLKNYGIHYEQINLKEVRNNLDETDHYTKEEIDKFAEHFINTYKHYEETKKELGIDYADMLNDFLKLKKSKIYEYVLLDELQDVNSIEADIGLKSGKNFIAVGDKKQAIFGFQGGSINNFKKFNGKKFVLGENFRSSNPILDYSKYFFMKNTADDTHKEDLENLKNNTNDLDIKPVVYDVEKNKIYAAASELTKTNNGDSIAIITRTNRQILEVSEELKNRGIDHATTFFSASADAKNNIITFLKGLFSKNPETIKNALFTPFSPITLRDAFELSSDYNIKLEDIYKKSPEFKALRESINNLEDVNSLFDNLILPSSVNYGKQYLLAAMNIRNSCKEAGLLEGKSLQNFIDYILASDLLTDEVRVKKDVVVTTIHKSKGLQFDTVIYLPSKTKDNSNFQDHVVEAILMSHGINAKEELEEETLRMDFVAFTRAKKKLFILTPNVEDYLTEHAVLESIDAESIDSFDFAERNKKAYSFFVSGEYEKAKEIIQNDDKWLIEFVNSYFESLDRVSYSSLPDSPFIYLTRSILKLRDEAPAMKLGSKIHDYAENVLKGNKPKIDKDIEPYVDNINSMIDEIKAKYPKLHEAEQNIVIPLSDITQDNHGLNFKAKIDAIFKNDNGEFLIVDWKTDKDDSRASKHRQQLEAYKRAFCSIENIDYDKVEVAIGFVGLRSKINMGNIDCKLDSKSPSKSSFGTFEKKLKKILDWKSNPVLFFEDLKDENLKKEPLWRAVIEQYELEK